LLWAQAKVLIDSAIHIYKTCRQLADSVLKPSLGSTPFCGAMFPWESQRVRDIVKVATRTPLALCVPRSCPPSRHHRRV
jgi:hypothetical protein